MFLKIEPGEICTTTSDNSKSFTSFFFLAATIIYPKCVFWVTESAGKDFSFFLLSFSFLAQFGAVNGNFFDPSCVILTHLFEARGEGGSLCSKETDTKVGFYDCGVS